jgi:nitrate/nitrite transporter NarK
VFPIAIRGTGAGFAASFAKIGAVMTAFLFPILLKDIGTDLLLLILVATSLLGAVVTWAYAFETKGVSLEKIDEKAALTTPSPRRAIKIRSSAPSGDHA